MENFSIIFFDEFLKESLKKISEFLFFFNNFLEESLKSSKKSQWNSWGVSRWNFAKKFSREIPQGLVGNLRKKLGRNASTNPWRNSFQKSWRNCSWIPWRNLRRNSSMQHRETHQSFLCHWNSRRHYRWKSWMNTPNNWWSNRSNWRIPGIIIQGMPATNNWRIFPKKTLKRIPGEILI